MMSTLTTDITTDAVSVYDQPSVPDRLSTPDSLMWYMSRAYRSFNRTLRNGERLEVYEQRHYNALESLLTVKSRPQTLYRGVNRDFVKQYVNMRRWSKTVVCDGAIVTDAFLSTSASKTTASSFAHGGILFELTVPEPLAAICVGDYDNGDGEQETIFAPGHWMVITAIKPVANQYYHYHAHAELVADYHPKRRWFKKPTLAIEPAS